MSTPQIIEELSFETALNRVKTMLQEALPSLYKNLNESDPAIAILEIIAYIETLLRARVNNAVLATFIDTAKGTDLDNLVSFLALERKLIQEEDNSTTPPTEAVYESDEALRERFKEALQGLSVAGPASAYVHFARLADKRVKDASVTSPAPSEVSVYLTSYEYETGQASQNLIDTVTAYLRDEEIRPLGDLVNVFSGVALTGNVFIEVLIKDSVLDKQEILNKVQTNAENYFFTLTGLGSFYSKSHLIKTCFEGVENELLGSVVVYPQDIQYYQAPKDTYFQPTVTVIEDNEVIAKDASLKQLKEKAGFNIKKESEVKNA